MASKNNSVCRCTVCPTGGKGPLPISHFMSQLIPEMISLRMTAQIKGLKELFRNTCWYYKIFPAPNSGGMAYIKPKI